MNKSFTEVRLDEWLQMELPDGGAMLGVYVQGLLTDALDALRARLSEEPLSAEEFDKWWIANFHDRPLTTEVQNELSCFRMSLKKYIVE